MFKLLCLEPKISKGNVCKIMVVCIRMHECVCRDKDRAYTFGLCNKALSCNDIPNLLLHKSQVYVYVHRTNKKKIYRQPETSHGLPSKYNTCWTHSQMPYPGKRFFSVKNVLSIAVGVTEMWCSGQRTIPISRRSWNIIHRM
jgi:hypothetical protein